MFRLLSLLLALAPVVLLSTGCSILSAPDDYAYGAYGGATPRVDRIHGRVGSISGPISYVEEAVDADDEILEGASPETLPEVLPPGEEIDVELAI